MRKEKRAFVNSWRFTALVLSLVTAALILLTSAAQAHKAHEYPADGKVGASHPISAVCGAFGASKVARADLQFDDHRAGNVVFSVLAKKGNFCHFLAGPVKMTITETTYVGATPGGLHVYITEFAKGVYSVMTVRRATTAPDGDSI